MRVGEKMAAAFILLILIPLIVSAFFNKIYSSNYSYAVCMDENKRAVISRSEMLNSMFEDILSDMKSLASDEVIRMFAENGSGGASDEGVQNLIEFFRKQNDAHEMDIIDTEGKVIASSDPLLVGKQADIFTENSAGNNGISSMFIRHEDSDIQCFSVVRTIYSGSNENLGFIYAVYDYTKLKSVADAQKTSRFIKIAETDSSGNLIDEPYGILLKYDKYKQFSPASEVFEKEDRQIEYNYENRKHSAYSKNIECSGWTVVGIADLEDFNGERRSSSSLVVLFALLSAAGVIILCIRFTAPLRSMIAFLDRKRKGDVAVHLNIGTSDEYGTIAKEFNEIFDDIAGSELRYRTIAEMSEDIVFEVNFSRNTVTVSNNFNNKFSFRPKDESVEESFFYKWRIHKDDKDKFSADVEKIFGSSDNWKGEYRFKNKYGDFAWVLIKARKLRDRNDVPYGIVGVIRDIDREKSNELHLINKASFDALTQLYNRDTFIKKLSEELNYSRHRKTLDAVMFIDLDDFKHFNDEYGHSCGDEVLKFTADTIKEISFGHGFGGRFGGDEFIVCVTGMTLLEDAGNIASEMIRILQNGFFSESSGKQLTVTCSIGIAYFRENGNTADEVITAADSAMYKIKKHGKSSFAYAQADDNAEGVILKEGKPIDSDNPGQ